MYEHLLFLNELTDKTVEEIKELTFNNVWNTYQNKIEPVKDQVLEAEKVIVLRTIDRTWINHIDIMDKLRNGIHLRSYAQDNPLQAYIKEGYEMFEDMINTIDHDVVLACINIRVVTHQEE